MIGLGARCSVSAITCVNLARSDWCWLEGVVLAPISMVNFVRGGVEALASWCLPIGARVVTHGDWLRYVDAGGGLIGS